MNICEYKEKPCKFWDEECLAVFPEQYPYNSKADVKAIKEWQRRIVKKEKRR